MKKGYCENCDDFMELPDDHYCNECIEAMKRGGIASD